MNPAAQQPFRGPGKGTALPVVRYDSTILRQQSRHVAQGEFELPEFKEFAQNLVATMRSYNGAGIAAVQCGVLARVIVIANGSSDIVMVNPTILEFDSQEVIDKEGCLSYPGAFAKNVSRPAAVKVAYQDVDGSVREKTLTGTPARAVFHEIEHLDGKLLIDHVKKFDREAFRMQLTKFDRLIKKLTKPRANQTASRRDAIRAAKNSGRKAGRR